jgi:hypothetical protein
MELGISAVFCLNWGKKPDLNFALYSDKKMWTITVSDPQTFKHSYNIEKEPIFKYFRFFLLNTFNWKFFPVIKALFFFKILEFFIK